MDDLDNASRGSSLHQDRDDIINILNKETYEKYSTD